MILTGNEIKLQREAGNIVISNLPLPHNRIVGYSAGTIRQG